MNEKINNLGERCSLNEVIKYCTEMDSAYGRVGSVQEDIEVLRKDISRNGMTGLKARIINSLTKEVNAIEEEVSETSSPTPLAPLALEHFQDARPYAYATEAFEALDIAMEQANLLKGIVIVAAIAGIIALFWKLYDYFKKSKSKPSTVTFNLSLSSLAKNSKELSDLSAEKRKLVRESLIKEYEDTGSELHRLLNSLPNHIRVMLDQTEGLSASTKNDIKVAAKFDVALMQAMTFPIIAASYSEQGAKHLDSILSEIQLDDERGRLVTVDISAIKERAIEDRVRLEELCNKAINRNSIKIMEDVAKISAKSLITSSKDSVIEEAAAEFKGYKTAFMETHLGKTIEMDSGMIDKLMSPTALNFVQDRLKKFMKEETPFDDEGKIKRNMEQFQQVTELTDNIKKSGSEKLKAYINVFAPFLVKLKNSYELFTMGVAFMTRVINDTVKGAEILNKVSSILAKEVAKHK